MILLFFATSEAPPAPTYPEAYAYLWRQSMNLTRKVSTTTYPIVFMMVDSTDHITGETGLTPTVTLSKNGGGYAAAAGSVTELGGGLYALAGNATDRDTLGELWVHADGGAGVDKADFKVDIVSHDPYGDLSTVKAITDQFVFTVANQVDANALSGGGSIDAADIRAAVGLSTANLDTQLSTIDSEIGTIYSEMASVDDVLTPLAVVDANVDAILADTGTDGVKIADTQGAITWGQQKIVADVAYQGALDIQNTNDNGAGKSTFGGMAGEYNYGVAVAGVYNQSEEGTGLKNVGESQNVEGFDPAQATEATLTAMKGDGWMDETLVKIVTDIAAIQAGSGATPQQIWEYATRVLTAGTNIDLSALATATDLATVDTVVDAIKAKTDNLPANTATALAAIQSDLDNPDQYKADVSGLATTAHVQEVENKIDAIDVTVNTIPTNPLLDTAYTEPDNAGIAAILEDTGTTIPATLAGLATSAEVGAITMLDEVVVGSYTMQDILKILAAKMVGKATGGGTATITYRGVDDTSDVIIETVDSNGNRSAVTLTV